MHTDITECNRLKELLVKAKTSLETRLYTERKQYAKKLMDVQEEERKRISRDLHDDTAQYLSLLALELDTLIDKEKSLTPAAISRLENLRAAAGKALQEVRRFSHELRPSMLESLGLCAAVELLINEINALGKICVSFDIDGSERRLTDETELVLFRITQEALSNIRKHSHATQAKVKIFYTSDSVRLSISDNGQGFDASQTKAPGTGGGLGLVGMKERAQLIGASFRLKTKIGTGTSISVIVPYPAP